MSDYELEHSDGIMIVRATLSFIMSFLFIVLCFACSLSLSISELKILLNF